MQAKYAVSWDNFIPYGLTEKLPFGSLFNFTFPFALCRDDRWFVILFAPGHNRATPELSMIHMLWKMAEEAWG